MIIGTLPFRREHEFKTGAIRMCLSAAFPPTMRKLILNRAYPSYPIPKCLEGATNVTISPFEA
jgi:hypothetical protein